MVRLGKKTQFEVGFHHCLHIFFNDMDIYIQGQLFSVVGVVVVVAGAKYKQSFALADRPRFNAPSSAVVM